MGGTAVVVVTAAAANAAASASLAASNAALAANNLNHSSGDIGEGGGIALAIILIVAVLLIGVSQIRDYKWERDFYSGYDSRKSEVASRRMTATAAIMCFALAAILILVIMAVA